MIIDTNFNGVFIGSPIYPGSMTGETKSFLKRLTFPYHVYDLQRSSLFKKKISIGMIYTMGADESRIKEIGYEQNFDLIGTFMNPIFGHSESLLATDTNQFDNYSKYAATGMDSEAKARRLKEVFPLDCQKAYYMGARFADTVN